MCVGPLGGRGLDVGWSGLWGWAGPGLASGKDHTSPRGDLSFPDRGLCWNLLLLPSLRLPCGLVKGQREGGWREEGGGTDRRCGDPLWRAWKEAGTLISGPRKDVLKLRISPLGTVSSCPAASCLDRPLPLESSVAEKQEEEGSRKLLAFVLGFWARSTS